MVISLGATMIVRAPDLSPESRQGGIHDDVAGDPDGALEGVSLAIDPGVPFEGAAQVEPRVDDRPVAVDLDPFELGKVLASAGCLGVLAFFQVEAAVEV